MVRLVSLAIVCGTWGTISAVASESSADGCCCYGEGSSHIEKCNADGHYCTGGIYGKHCSSELAVQADNCCCFGTGWCDGTGYCAGIGGAACSAGTATELATPSEPEHPQVELTSSADGCCCYGEGSSHIEKCNADGHYCTGGIYGKHCSSELAVQADNCCCFGTGWCDDTGYCAGIGGAACSNFEAKANVEVKEVKDISKLEVNVNATVGCDCGYKCHKNPDCCQECGHVGEVCRQEVCSNDPICYCDEEAFGSNLQVKEVSKLEVNVNATVGCDCGYKCHMNPDCCQECGHVGEVCRQEVCSNAPICYCDEEAFASNFEMVV